MFWNKVFAYENSYGDKGIIIARNRQKAERIYRKKYPERKITDDSDDYDNGGAYLFEVGRACGDKLYDTFPW